MITSVQAVIRTAVRCYTGCPRLRCSVWKEAAGAIFQERCTTSQSEQICILCHYYDHNMIMVDH